MYSGPQLPNAPTQHDQWQGTVGDVVQNIWKAKGLPTFMSQALSATKTWLENSFRGAAARMTNRVRSDIRWLNKFLQLIYTIWQEIPKW